MKGEKKNYVLAMYDIRGKQEFIYRSTSIKEIVGGSAIIRDCFKDYLLPAAKIISQKYEGNELGIYFYDTDKEETESFSVSKMEKRFSIVDEKEKKGYIGEVIYDGGGNFLLIYKSHEYFFEVTKQFTKSLLEAVPTLKVLGTCVTIYDFTDYKKDLARLYDKHRQNENMESVISLWGSLPICQVDYETSFPFTHSRINEEKKREKITTESHAKYVKWAEENKSSNKYLKGGKILDKMVTEKDKDSWLAVIYIDGNNMGYKVQKSIENCGPDYNSRINGQRKFSREIQEIYIKEGLKQIDHCVFDENKKEDSYRIVVNAGDEITFIVNAHDAFRCAKAYLESLPEGHSACAGIALFRSHAPYSEAYRIAEECCEEGKRLMKKNEMNGAIHFLDFHVCQGAIGTELKDIRRRENEDGIISRPWLIKYDDSLKDTNPFVTMNDLYQVEQYFMELGRSNIKGFPAAAKEGIAAFQLELNRIESHNRKEDDSRISRPKIEENKLRKLVYDMAIVYDFWGKSWEQSVRQKTEDKKGE